MWKKKLLFVGLIVGVLLMVSNTTVKSQPKAIGVRFGWVGELSYQHTLGPGFLEFGLGVPGYNAGLALNGTYNWVLYKNNSSKRDHFEFFAGGGFGLHTIFLYYYGNMVGLGLLGEIGAQYQFSIPLQIGLSWRPMFGGVFYNGSSSFYLPGLYDFGIALRYAF